MQTRCCWEVRCSGSSKNRAIIALNAKSVILLPLYRNKTCKTILTRSAIHDTLYRKSHQICRKVQNGEDLFPMKIFTALQYTRFILPPIHPTKSIAALHGRYFSFSQIKSYVVVQSSKICFFVVDCTTVKCYSCAWKKQNVVSALRSAFFILYLESCISRLNVIPCHDLTPSVSEPDNAAAQTGAGTSFGANGDPLTWAAQLLLIFAP